MKHTKYLKNKRVEYEIATWGAPVQFLGTIDGKPFYFRARYNKWKFAVAKDPNVHPASVESPKEGFIIGEDYGTEKYAASWMPLREARKIVFSCIEKYLEDTQ